MYGGYQGQGGPYGLAPPQPLQAPHPYGAGNAIAGPSSYGGAGGAYGISPQPYVQAPYAFSTPPQQHQPLAVPAHDPYMIANDPAAFEQLFREHLVTLTFNSKQIINMLTMMAEDHKDRMSAVVARAVDGHIASSPPQYRLPGLYLLDSICKNVGYPYPVLWAPHIGRLFMDTYRLVDVGVKRKLEDLLATWRDSGSGGGPMFGAEAQSGMEKNLFGSNYVPPTPAQPVLSPPLHVAMPAPPPMAAHHAAPQPFTPQAPQPDAKAMSRARGMVHNMVGRIDAQLRAAHQDLRSRPEMGAETQARIAALQGLQQMVQSGALADDDFAKIDAQLKEMEGARSNAQAQQVPPLGNVSGLPPNLAGALSSFGAPGPGEAQPDMAKDLLSKLMASGLLGPTGTFGKVPEQDDDYVNSIMGIDIKLTVQDLQREPPMVELLLHEHLPSQCKQCARRFPAGDKGKKIMDEHLDWHFRQNKRVKDSLARGQSRQWFLRLEEFIRGGFDDTPPSAQQDGADDAEGTGLTREQEKALKARFASTYVVAPTDPDIVAKPCPICKESFKSVYNEDEEEWVWYDAMEVNGTYYHASCHHSAQSLSASVKRESTPDGADSVMRSRSRSSTPTAATATKKEESNIPADPLSRVKAEEGVPSPKRKREDLEANEIKPEGEDSEPPSKKQASELSISA